MVRHRTGHRQSYALSSPRLDGYSRAKGAERRVSFTVWGQEIISMKMRRKFPNEFPIKRPRLSCPGNACEFYEWACVGDGVAHWPAPTFPYAAPATCRAARCCLPAGCDLACRQPVSCFGWGSESCRPESLPHRLWRRRVGRTTYPLGPSFCRVFGMVTETAGSEVSLQVLFP